MLFILMMLLIPVPAAYAVTPSADELNASRALVDQVLQDIDVPATLESIARAQADVQAISPDVPPGDLNNLPGMDPQTLSQIRSDVVRLLQEVATTPEPAPQPQTDAMKNGPLVLVSFSMPDALLHQLGREVQRAQGALVVRGLVNNDWIQTAERLQSIAQQSEIPVLLDPTIFDRFGVQAVPAFVVAEGLQACITTDSCEDFVYARISGAVTLDYALDVIRSQASDERIKARADQYLNRLEMRP